MSSAVTPESSQATLVALMGSWSQTNRLLRVHTPLGPDVLLAEELKGIECVSGMSSEPTGSPSVTGFVLQLDALSLNAHIDLKSLIGQPILVELQTDQSRTALRPLHGHVTNVSCVGSNGGMARYRLTIEPWLRFLGTGRDSAVFQDMDVLEIVQAIFTDYQSSLQGTGKLQPAWRLDVADTSLYPKRSLTTQYQESDLNFVERLLMEEGLFYWFEHTGDASNASLGGHTLVIADHNGAFKANARATVRFSQSKGTITDDTIDQWSPQASWHTHAVEVASWDYRSLSVRPVAEHAMAGSVGTAHAGSEVPALISQDTPGAYAYETAAQGQRLARNHLQALTAARQTTTACGTVRAASVGSKVTLSGHASHDGSNIERDSFVYLRLIHHARNNLSADLSAQARQVPTGKRSTLDDLVGRDVVTLVSSSQSSHDNATVFYRNAAQVLLASTPYRAASQDGHGHLIHPKPNVIGQQTALVIGVPSQHLTTDRDHRIKVQFAWQRGTSSQSRLAHPAPDNHSGAPAQDGSGSPSSSSSPSGSGSTTGTWVRVASTLAPVAGANFGGVALPRVGQEVLVVFVNGDIDRPVVVGAVYNGQGADNQQTNQIAAGAANATGNAPMWFPGDQEASGKQGKLPGHAHNAVLSGIKTQALSASQTGTGGYNQIVFDDTPGQSRLGLQSHAKQSGSHAGETELNLGALRQQTDNQRLGVVGYGFELKTHYSGAIRSGSGLILSADKRQGNESGSASAQMDSKEAQAQLESGKELVSSLIDTAQQHKTMLPVLKTTEAKPDKLPVVEQLAHNVKAMADKTSGSGGDKEGGAGDATGYSEPLMVLSAPAGIALVTPQSASFNAGQTTSVAAGQDINLLAGANAGHVVKYGISLFTYGKASNPKKPNQEVGISLHAASGKVSSQSQSDKTQITADKGIQVNSTTDAVQIQAKQHVLLTAQGAYIKMSGGNIEVHAPGKVDIKASMKSWTGPKSDSNSLTMPKVDLKGCAMKVAGASQSGAASIAR
jgi:type VI secretion system secreted protein VgrG